MFKGTFFRDKHGHLSTKRVVGVFGVLLSTVLAVLSGFHFYEIDTYLILGMLATFSGLLGVTSFERPPSYTIQEHNERGDL